MSSPWAVIGLHYDGSDLQLADLSLYLWIQSGLNEVPVVRGTDTTVPGKPGRSEGNRVNDVLPIVLVGQVTSDPTALTQAEARESFRTTMRAVRTLFASNRSRANLVADLEDGATATISARPLNILVPKMIESVYASLSIEMEGYDDWLIVDGS